MSNPFMVTTKDPQRFSIHYEDGGSAEKRSGLEGLWKRFNQFDPATNLEHSIWYRPTNRNMEVWVDYTMPPDAPLAMYRIEVFVPRRHATSRKTIFSVAHNFQVKDGGEVEHEDVVRSLDLANHVDQWVSLGEFILDPASQAMSGRVRQYDLSLEDPPQEITFGPVRWIQLTGLPGPQPPEGQPVQGTPRFDSPVGSQAERDGALLEGVMFSGLGPAWHGVWYDANPYLTWYAFGYHTGADLNIRGVSSADRDAPIYAVADGKVIYAGKAGSWGNIVVVEHPLARVSLPDGSVREQKVYSRYGHVSDRILVRRDDAVRRGQNIAFIGLAEGATTGWHLHFDVGYTGLLKSQPGHWPDLSNVRALQKKKISPNSKEFRNAQLAVKQVVMAHYLDPHQFLRDNHRS
jgi:murein DD-endopeptidase MepM/ murein hydrolase activator NlpD